MTWLFSFATFFLFFRLGNSFKNHIDIDDFLNSEIRLFPNHTVHLVANYEEEALERFKSMLDNEDILNLAYLNFQRTYGERRNFTINGGFDGSIRKGLFKDNLVYIFQHNLFTRTKLQSQFEMGINKFMDMHLDEIKMERLGLNIPKHDDHPPPISHQSNHTHPQRALPSHFDWRDHDNVISSVKDQAKCGACVMFAMTSALEGHHALCSRVAQDLSEQFMVDCAIRANGYRQNKGCDGNTFPDTLKFAVDHGVTSELLYPYEGKQGKCKFDGILPVTRIKEVKRLPDNGKDVKTSIMNEGPVSIGLWVFKPFLFYKTGIYDACGHPSSSIGGHAMAITGFREEGRTPYYIIKNQWGEEWGEQGYVKYTSADPRCGIEKLAFNYVVEC